MINNIYDYVGFCQPPTNIHQQVWPSRENTSNKKGGNMTYDIKLTISVAVAAAVLLILTMVDNYEAEPDADNEAEQWLASTANSAVALP